MEAQSLTERLIAYLHEHGIEFTVMTHQPVRTSEEAARVRGTPLEQGAKALLFQADDRTVLLVLPANRRVDSRAFKHACGVKNLRMIPADELRDRTGLEVGAVPPFGNLMDFPTYVDERLLDLPRISFNAGSRTVSVVMSPGDYQRLVNPIVGHFAADEQS
jgi:Ala-tRNA(Pro) deacylase